MYSGDEHNKKLPVILKLSNPSSIDITVKVSSDPFNATSKFTFYVKHICYANLIHRNGL